MFIREIAFTFLFMHQTFVLFESKELNLGLGRKKDDFQIVFSLAARETRDCLIFNLRSGQVQVSRDERLLPRPRAVRQVLRVRGQCAGDQVLSRRPPVRGQRPQQRAVRLSLQRRVRHQGVCP
jgi:hypothetical protein